MAQELEIYNYDFARCQTNLWKNGPYCVEDVIQAIRATDGNLTEMARLLGRNRTRLRDFIYGNKEVFEVFLEVREELVDIAERQLRRLVEDGDPATIRYVLSTIGKERGYNIKLPTQQAESDENEKVSIYLPDNKRNAVNSDG